MLPGHLGATGLQSIRWKARDRFELPSPQSIRSFPRWTDVVALELDDVTTRQKEKNGTKERKNNTKAKKLLSSDIKKSSKTYMLTDYSNTPFKKGKEIHYIENNYYKNFRYYILKMNNM